MNNFSFYNRTAAVSRADKTFKQLKSGELQSIQRPIKKTRAGRRWLNRIVGLLSFLCRGFFVTRILPNEDKVINTYCNIGARFSVLKQSPMILKVRRTKSLLFYLLPHNIFRLVFKIFFVIPLPIKM